MDGPRRGRRRRCDGAWFLCKSHVHSRSDRMASSRAGLLRTRLQPRGDPALSCRLLPMAQNGRLMKEKAGHAPPCPLGSAQLATGLGLRYRLAWISHVTSGVGL